MPGSAVDPQSPFGPWLDAAEEVEQANCDPGRNDLATIAKCIHWQGDRTSQAEAGVSLSRPGGVNHRNTTSQSKVGRLAKLVINLRDDPWAAKVGIEEDLCIGIQVFGGSPGQAGRTSEEERTGIYQNITGFVGDVILVDGSARNATWVYCIGGRIKSQATIVISLSDSDECRIDRRITADGGIRRTGDGRINVVDDGDLL